MAAFFTSQLARRRGRCWQPCTFARIQGRGLASLAYERVTAGDGEEDSDRMRTAIIIHGLMGAGKNLRTLAKHLLKAVQERSPSTSAGWQFVLVDLRNHGNSAALQHLTPPHNIQSAARDIADLVKSEAWKWPEVVMGHSLGGKVALEFGESCAKGQYDSSGALPKQLWVLDSVPGNIDVEQNGEVERVLKAIQRLPDPLPSRRWLTEQLLKEGFSKSLGDWLGSNLKRIDPSSEQMTWIFDVKSIYDMYLSYRQTNYWPFLDSPPQGTDIGIVRAQYSDRWYPEIISHLQDLAKRSNISYHVLEKAGHWLHVDNQSGLIEILVPSFVRLAFQECDELRQENMF